MKVLSPADSAYRDELRALDRRAIPSRETSDTVRDILADVRERGDAALVNYAEKFDHVSLSADALLVSEDEIATAQTCVSEATRAAVAASLRNIHDFASHSLRQDWSAKNIQGAEFGERFQPFNRVGVYVPGGKAPLVSTALMTAGFAQAAGVKNIVAATPCGPDGALNPALLYALVEAGATEILKVGGAQGVGALAYGTASLEPVDKIVGPGNPWVVEAKRQLVGAVSIDLLPGPSEIMVLADDSGNAAFIAADLLGQAEHGPDSEIAFLTTSERLIGDVQKEISRQAAQLSRGEMIAEVLENQAFAVLLESIEQGVELCNAYAPEHLSLIVADEERWLPEITTSGAIYLGNDSPVAVGDFLAGPSHTLPTGGSSKAFSGLRADQFQRRTSIVRLDTEAVRQSVEHVEEFARIEGLDAHGRSARIRLE